MNVEWKPTELMASRVALAQKWGRLTGVPSALILAVVQQESGGRAGAVRAESGYLTKYKDTSKFREIAKATGLADEQIATSYGLMQMMLPLAWGYMSECDKGQNAIVALLNPEKNVRYGSAHLATLITKGMKQRVDYDSVRKAAGLYNGGGYNSPYAENVAALWQRYDAWLRGVK